MEKRSRIRAMKRDVRGSSPADGWTLLILNVIYQAALDVRRGRYDEHYWSAVKFFESEYYGWMLDFLAAAVPDFEPVNQLPEGVRLPLRRR